MRFINELCPPALLYLLFLVVNVGLDISGLHLYTALLKTLFGGATVYALELLCKLDLGIVSWFVVAMPFVVTALGTSIALGLDIDANINKVVSGKTNPFELIQQVQVTYKTCSQHLLPSSLMCRICTHIFVTCFSTCFALHLHTRSRTLLPKV
jgi:hypothetical protein